MREAIILAGGMGTRLKGVIYDIPKPMAPIGDVPFLSVLFDYLLRNNVERAILSVGYKYEVIETYYGLNYKGLELVYSVEETPLGTGGAIQLALEHVQGEDVVILNGDSFIDADLQQFSDFALSHDADFGLVIKRMTNIARYGTVITQDDKVLRFQEKQELAEGDINTGVYYMKTSFLATLNFPVKFSFETDFMEKYCGKLDFYSFPVDGFFIDIGVPEDYARAQNELI